MINNYKIGFVTSMPEIPTCMVCTGNSSLTPISDDNKF